MNNGEKLLALLSKFYQKSGSNFDALDEEIYFGGIESIGVDKAFEALMKIARTKGLNKIPSVGDILEAAGVCEPDADDEANMVAGKIIQCISAVGGYNAERARARMGDLCWAVVERFGGWESLCMLEEENMGMVRAQLRDLAYSVKSFASIGGLNSPMNLPSNPREEITDARNEAMKLIEGMTKN